MINASLKQILYQVPAFLLYKKSNSSEIYASHAFFVYFLSCSGDASESIQVQFYEIDTTNEFAAIFTVPQSEPENDDLARLVDIEINNQRFRCSFTTRLLKHEGQEWVVLGIEANSNELTLNARNLASAEQHVSFNQLMSTLSSKLISASENEIDTIIKQCLAAFGNFCGVDRCYLFEFIDNATIMSNTHEWVAEGVNPYIEDLQNLPSSALPYFIRHIKKGLFRLNDVESLPAEAELERIEFTRESISSILCLPIYLNGDLFGFIGCDIIGSPYEWKDHDVEYLSRIAEMLGSTIENLKNRKVLEATQLALMEANTQLQKLANIDGLTGIANRRLFDNTLERDFQRCSSQSKHLSLLFLDVDYFKAFNDLYGHVEGDSALQQIAKSLSESCTGNDDLVCRYGGEEFAIILPNTCNTMANKIAERIRKNIAKLGITHLGSNHKRHLTVSIGLVTSNCENSTTPSLLVSKADKALYRAKSAGRNCIRESLDGE